MLGSASSEFIALCQSQVLLLTQALGASSTVVYLAERSSDLVSPTLVPLVAYPDDASVWSGLEAALSTMENTLPQAAPEALDSVSLLNAEPPAFPQPGRDSLDSSPSRAGQGSKWTFPGMFTPDENDTLPVDAPEAQASSQPLILPLAYEGIVLGVMVSTREAPAWNHREYQQAEQVAKSLAVACVMDQRNQWLQSQLQQRQLTQADQSQTFHDLLHQFRNPLTALQTFGKLLVKRMQPGDPNQSIAEGIVRETGRLQDLAQSFDETIDRGDADLAQTSPSMSLETLLLPGTESPSPQAVDSPSEENGAANSLAAGAARDIVQAPFTAGDLALGSSPLGAGPGRHSLGRDLNVIPGNIRSVVDPLLLSAEAIAQDRDLLLVQDIPPELPEVWLDAGALREVLSNLIDNAFKYAPRGSLIWVAGGLVQSLNGDLYQGIAIGDTGPGIPRQDQDHIFERHYRGVQTDSSTPGTGLGLAIVQELVTGMGGKVDLISPVQLDRWLPTELAPRAVGPGSLFIVWLKTV